MAIVRFLYRLRGVYISRGHYNDPLCFLKSGGFIDWLGNC